MNLTSLLIYIGIAGVLLTLITFFGFKKKENVLTSFLQNFCGALFIFSGWVKAVDPLGTAYKMEDYFNEFVQTFEPTMFSFLNPIFDWMHSQSVAFSVFMIVFEIILGVMLILGARPKLTSWLFFLLVAFFTILTGFTFTTGYVPEGINYFDFGSWVAHTETNMKVTDCGCFGDFIKLKPFTSFMKDVFLLVPAVIFLIWNKKFHQLSTRGLRGTILIVTTIGLIIYCLSNFYWDIPSKDFRPFKEGTDVRAIKKREEVSTANVQILAYRLKKEGEDNIIEIPYEQYIANYKEYKKSDGWSVVEQVLSKPEVEPTKISDFTIEDFEDNNVTDLYLNPEGGYRFMVVSYTMKGDSEIKTQVVKDTINHESFTVVGQDTLRKLRPEIVEKEVETTVYTWDEEFAKNYTDKIKPLAEAAKKAKISTDVIIGGASVEQVIDFQSKYDLPVNYHKADNILLKTIVRSNPGVVLWKDGKIVKKWHVKKLPEFKEIKSEYIKE